MDAGLTNQLASRCDGTVHNLHQNTLESSKGAAYCNCGAGTDIRHTEMYLNGSHVCNMFSMEPHTQSKCS